MMKQNGDCEEEILEEKQAKTHDGEAGMDANGEFSVELMKNWLTRALAALILCTLAACLMAVLLMGKNQKESVIMEVNSDLYMAFSMNRRGSVLSAEGSFARNKENLDMTGFSGKSLGITVGRVFEKLADNSSLGEDGAVLISLRKSGTDSKASVDKLIKEVKKDVESELHKKESKAKVYVFEANPDGETEKIQASYKTTVTKACFLKQVFAENLDLTDEEKVTLGGYSVKRLIRELDDMDCQIPVDPVEVKTTFEKQDQTESQTESEASSENQTQAETSLAETRSGEETEESSTADDGLSEMQRRRKALAAGESVDWVDQEETTDTEDLEPQKTESGEKTKRSGYETTDTDTSEIQIETIPPENVIAPTEPQTEATETESSAAPTEPQTQEETTAPSYRRGPGFEDPDNHNDRAYGM